MHDHAKTEARQLRRALILTAAFLLVEVTGGFLANSLALLSDAGHMFIDALALSIALVAYTQASRPRDPQHTFGYRRLEVVAALVNGALLLWIAGVIAEEAWDRWNEGAVLKSGLMLGVAIVGLVVNLVGLAMLRHHHHDDLNMRGAFLHVLGDTVSSIGTIIAALVIHFTGWVRADAIASFLISLLILVGGIRLVLESLHYLMEGAPREIQIPELMSCLREHPGVLEVHDLHVWRISAGMDILTAHVVLQQPGDSGLLRSAMRTRLRERFGLQHVTLEIEGPEERDDPQHRRGICGP